MDHTTVGGKDRTKGLTGRESWLHEKSQEIYQQRLKLGVAREQARKDLPLSTYTEAYWKCDLHNIFHFLRLRMDSHAQYEIRVYANAMFELIKPICPIACEAFEDYRLNGDVFSKEEMSVLRHPSVVAAVVAAVKENSLLSDFSSRELREFKQKLGITQKLKSKKKQIVD